MAIMDPGFYKKLLRVTSELQMKPEDLLNVMALESGIDPTAHNANGNASGLIQFMPSTLKGLGFKGSHADFREMSAEDQLDYVKQYIVNNMKYNNGPFKSAAQYYVANFVPVALKLPGVQNEDPATVLVSKDPVKPHLPGVSIDLEKIYYRANTGLDADHDGNITYGDLQTVLNRASGGKNFRSALAQLQDTTGYVPELKSKDMPTNMLALQKTKPANDVVSILNNYLQQISASEKQNKKLYKRYLPHHNFTIKIASKNFTDSVEFARVLRSVLDERLLTTSFTHTDDKNVEIECSIYGPQNECFNLVKEITACVVKTFETATKKIGGIKVNTNFIINKKSSYQPIKLIAADLEYRKFLVKFI